MFRKSFNEIAIVVLEMRMQGKNAGERVFVIFTLEVDIQ